MSDTQTDELWAAFAASCWECGSTAPREDEFFCVKCLPGIEAATARANLRARIDMAVAAAVAEEREACACADDFNGNTADDLRAAIRARGAK